MTEGHGDDLHHFPHGTIRYNLSSNVLTGVNHDGLFRHLQSCMPELMHYPDPTPLRLEEALAKEFHIQSSEVCVTSGATEAIYLLAQMYQSRHSLIFEPSFAEYADACATYNHTIAHTMELPSTVDDIIWICNPNNPTGQVVDHQRLCDIIHSNPQALFIIDQSYEHFTETRLFSPAEAIAMGNVILIHSMTKQFCVPGLRIGYLTAPSHVLQSLRQLRMPWSVSTMALEGGLYLLRHHAEYQFDLHTLMKERDRVRQALVATGLMEVLPSDSHILLCRLLNGDAASFKQRLALDHGILIRDASNFYGLDGAYFRIAVQDSTANDYLLQVVQQISHSIR